jgi:hypothetical protein
MTHPPEGYVSRRFVVRDNKELPSEPDEDGAGVDGSCWSSALHEDPPNLGLQRLDPRANR